MAHKTDEEQIEDLKRWWESNGKYVIVVVLLLISGVVGGKVWLNYKHSTAENASMQYEAMVGELQAGKDDDAAQLGSDIIEKHSDMAYAIMSAFAVAKVEVDKNNLDSASKQLQWALDHAQDDTLKHIARLRLARVLLAANKLDDAMKYATPSDTGAYGEAYAMVKGDIFMQKGELNLARTAYRSALQSKTLSSQLRNIVQMKLDDISVPGKDKEAAL